MRTCLYRSRHSPELVHKLSHKSVTPWFIHVIYSTMKKRLHMELRPKSRHKIGCFFEKMDLPGSEKSISREISFELGGNVTGHVTIVC